MTAEPAHSEMRVLEEKFRALQTLIRHERDLEKLKIYKRELDLVNVQFQSVMEELEKRPNSKVLPFAPKGPVRSA